MAGKPEEESKFIVPILQEIAEKQTQQAMEAHFRSKQRKKDRQKKQPKDASSETSSSSSSSESESEDSDEPEEEKPETGRESLLNIVAELEKDFPPTKGELTHGIRVDQNTYLMQWNDNSAHLHWDGVAICWGDLDPKVLQRRIASCSKVLDIGTSNICALCAAGKVRKRRLIPLGELKEKKTKKKEKKVQ